MMSRTVLLVLAVGLVDSRNDLLNSLGSVDGNRRGVVSVDPPLHQKFSEAINMVRVKMREKNSINPALGNLHLIENARRARATIDDVDLIPRDDRGAGTGAIRVGQWGTGPTKGDIEAVGKPVHKIARKPFCHNAIHHGAGDLRAKKRKRRLR